MPTVEPELMQCMEVWGGNQAADNGVTMAGLDVWIYSQPYGNSDGGGDVYYVSSCATNRILRLLVADVSGHGQAVHQLAIELRRLMRRYVNHIDQNQFVRSMNEQFAASSEAGIFATAIVSTFFAPTSRLTLCNAGHPPPLLYRSAARQWSYLEETESAENSNIVNMPLGILDFSDYETFDVPLKVGDLVLCYTDSLVESNGPNGQLLGQQGLLETLRGLSNDDPTTLIPELLSAIGKQADGNLTTDDVTLLLFRPNGLGRRRPSLRQQVIATGKMLGAIAGSMKSGGEAVPWPDFKLPNLGGALVGPLNRLWSAPQKSQDDHG
jgi:sigma-B regulation protein RsbU (phosphoserine phosphatase)